MHLHSNFSAAWVQGIVPHSREVWIIRKNPKRNSYWAICRNSVKRLKFPKFSHKWEVLIKKNKTFYSCWLSCLPCLNNLRDFNSQCCGLFELFCSYSVDIKKRKSPCTIPVNTSIWVKVGNFKKCLYGFPP